MTCIRMTSWMILPDTRLYSTETLQYIDILILLKICIIIQLGIGGADITDRGLLLTVALFANLTADLLHHLLQSHRLFNKGSALGSTEAMQNAHPAYSS